MIRKLTFATALLAAPMAFADSHGEGPAGDAEAGETAFRACVTCHVVSDPEGNVLAGRNARTGPNLYGIIGRVAGSEEGFRYSPLMQAANTKEIVWDEASFAEYIPNATNFLREATGESGRSSMTPQRVSEEDAANLAAFLLSLVPAADGESEEEAASE